MEPLKHALLSLTLFATITLHFHLAGATPEQSSIAFATWLRSSYSFEIYSLPISSSQSHPPIETRLTDGNSVNYNGQFPNSPPSISQIPHHLPNHTHVIVYVTERDDTPNIYLDLLYRNSLTRSILEERDISTESETQSELTRAQVLLAGDVNVSMKDMPSLVGGNTLIYVSTHEDPGKPRASWTAVYSTELKTRLTRRLTPRGVADFSPAVSPSGEWTVVASYGEKGWQGEVEELGKDIYVFLTRNGSNRVKVIEHGITPEKF